MHSKKLKLQRQKGFTLIELMVSIAIFAFMTALVVARYGTFNQGILLTNLAYDVALTLRTAQSYGLNVKSAPTASANYSSNFNYPYGVHFDSGNSNNTKIIFFADTNIDSTYDAGEEISTYTIRRGSHVEKLCIDNGHGNDGKLQCNNVSTLDVIFKRPDPDAIITKNDDNTKLIYAEINLKSSDGGTKKVIVRQTGQIAVSN